MKSVDEIGRLAQALEQWNPVGLTRDTAAINEAELRLRGIGPDDYAVHVFESIDRASGVLYALGRLPKTEARVLARLSANEVLDLARRLAQQGALLQCVAVLECSAGRLTPKALLDAASGAYLRPFSELLIEKAASALVDLALDRSNLDKNSETAALISDLTRTCSRHPPADSLILHRELAATVEAKSRHLEFSSLIDFRKQSAELAANALLQGAELRAPTKENDRQWIAWSLEILVEVLAVSPASDIGNCLEASIATVIEATDMSHWSLTESTTLRIVEGLARRVADGRNYSALGRWVHSEIGKHKNAAFDLEFGWCRSFTEEFSRSSRCAVAFASIAAAIRLIPSGPVRDEYCGIAQAVVGESVPIWLKHFDRLAVFQDLIVSALQFLVDSGNWEANLARGIAIHLDTEKLRRITATLAASADARAQTIAADLSGLVEAADARELALSQVLDGNSCEIRSITSLAEEGRRKARKQVAQPGRHLIARTT